MHSNPDLLPPAVAALVRTALGASPQQVAPTFGGFSNLTLAATVAGRRCVIKAASRPAKRADVRREAELLGALYAGGLPCPQLLAFIEDAAWSVAITAALPGQNGLHILAEQPQQLPALFAQLGSVVHHAHHLDVRADSLAQRHAQATIVLAELDDSPELQGALLDSLAHDIWTRPPLGLVHGDMGLHNALWGDGGLALVDWEWAGLGPCALDLVWLRWTMHWRGLNARLWAVFGAAYGEQAMPELTPQEAQALALGQIALILARADPAGRAEWLRRAAWTLALDDQALMLLT